MTEGGASVFRRLPLTADGRATNGASVFALPMEARSARRADARKARLVGGDGVAQSSEINRLEKGATN